MFLNWSDFHLSSLGGVVINFPVTSVDTISHWRVFSVMILTGKVGVIRERVPPRSFKQHGTVIIKRFFNALLSCLLRACTRKSIFLYLVTSQVRDEKSQTFQRISKQKMSLLWNCSCFMGRALVMEGDMRNATGLLMCVENRLEPFLHTNHSFL